MAFDPSALFGSGEAEPNSDVMLAMMLAFLTRMLDNKRDPRHVQDEREIDSHEIPVRPRIEPMGGG
jgi:hypothetical protein